MEGEGLTRRAATAPRNGYGLSTILHDTFFKLVQQLDAVIVLKPYAHDVEKLRQLRRSRGCSRRWLRRNPKPTLKSGHGEDEGLLRLAIHPLRRHEGLRPPPVVLVVFEGAVEAGGSSHCEEVAMTGRARKRARSSGRAHRPPRSLAHAAGGRRRRSSASP